MVRKQLYVIAYDISIDRNRNKMSELLEEEGGIRINLSVYECMLRSRQLTYIIKEAENLIDRKTDQLAIYPVCRSCYAKSVYYPELEDHWQEDITVV